VGALTECKELEALDWISRAAQGQTAPRPAAQDAVSHVIVFRHVTGPNGPEWSQYSTQCASRTFASTDRNKNLLVLTAMATPMEHDDIPSGTSPTLPATRSVTDLPMGPLGYVRVEDRILHSPPSQCHGHWVPPMRRLYRAMLARARRFAETRHTIFPDTAYCG